MMTVTIFRPWCEQILTFYMAIKTGHYKIIKAVPLSNVEQMENNLFWNC